MNFKRILIIGSGTMGNGIAQVCAQKGLTVTLSDVSQENLDRAVKNIRWSIGKFIEKGKIQEEAETIMGRIRTCTDLEGAAEVDLVLEAVFEKIEVKQEVFKIINPLVSESTLLASNTSAIPISEIAAVLRRPENFIGLHFFNPATLMDVVEVIKGLASSEGAFQAGAEFVRLIGKEPIMVKRDIAGFLLNRINMLANMEAMRLVEQGVGTPADIDKGMCLAFGRKMGPLETSDMVGLEVQLMAYTNVYEDEKDARFYPPAILKRKVLAGHLGRKTGKGWYEYNPDGTRKK